MIFTLVCAYSHWFVQGGVSLLDENVTGDALLRLLFMNRCLLATIHRWGRLYKYMQDHCPCLEEFVILGMLGWYLGPKDAWMVFILWMGAW